MFRIAFVLLITLESIATSIAQPAPQDEIKDALVHAESLYFGARFNESIALLTRIDDVLKTQPGRLPEKIDTKLQLALAHIGLNEGAMAKSLLVELYALDSNYALDPEHFSPKVIAVAAEAKAEQTKIQCQASEADARTYLAAGKTTALFDLLRSSKSKCAALAAIEPEAAELFFRTGMAEYKRGEFSNALSDFEAALTLSPGHELAFQYVDITQSKLQLTEDRLLLQWQRNFDARQLTAAAADYRQIMSSNKASSAETIKHVTGEYRKVLATLVETWNRTCPGGDAAAMSSIRGQISDLLPEPSFAQDIRSQMTACSETSKSVSTKTNAELKTAPTGTHGCMDMPSQIALTRLKTRVDPVITNEIRYYLKNNAQVMVRAKVRISENGDVTVTGLPDGNPVLNNVVGGAVAQWKFVPARDQSGSRCVDTEIPIAIKMAQ